MSSATLNSSCQSSRNFSGLAAETRQGLDTREEGLSRTFQDFVDFTMNISTTMKSYLKLLLLKSLIEAHQLTIIVKFKTLPLI